MNSRSIMIAALLLTACGSEATPPPPREFDGQRAFELVERQLAFGPRIPGSDGHAAMARWLDSVSTANADTVIVQSWSHRTVSGESIPMFNVIARFNPSATRRALYLAHWDTRPHSDSQHSSDSIAPVPGANDGASGVAVLVAVMEVLSRQRPTVGVDIMFVDGEDYGEFVPPYADVLIGSTWYSRNVPPPGKPDFAVVWDMVGAIGARFGVEGQSAIAAPDVVDRVWGMAERMGYGHLFHRGSIGLITDDHVPLIKAGMRAIDVIGWPYDPYWHTPDDTIDRISVETLTGVGNVAVGVIREFDRP